MRGYAGVALPSVPPFHNTRAGETTLDSVDEHKFHRNNATIILQPPPRAGRLKRGAWTTHYAVVKIPVDNVISVVKAGGRTRLPAERRDLPTTRWKGLSYLAARRQRIPKPRGTALCYRACRRRCSRANIYTPPAPAHREGGCMQPGLSTAILAQNAKTTPISGLIIAR